MSAGYLHTSRDDLQPAPSQDQQGRVDPETIRTRAHRLWDERGRRSGHADEDWFEAERQLVNESRSTPSSSKAVDECAKQSFPASDPPASHLPDEPPSNAEAKWEAAGIDREALSRDQDLEVANSPQTLSASRQATSRRQVRARRADSRTMK